MEARQVVASAHAFETPGNGPPPQQVWPRHDACALYLLLKRIASYEPGLYTIIYNQVHSNLGQCLLFGATVFETSAVINRGGGGYSPAVAFANGGALAMSGGERDHHPQDVLL
jgi:hypothetical protein